MFENRMLWIVFVPRREKVVEGWTKRRREELRDLYSSRKNIKSDQRG
jgi:hypothetical protein